MPQITPFARAALIEFLVLSLFTGQMSKLPPHGTSPAGPARAPGGAEGARSAGLLPCRPPGPGWSRSRHLARSHPRDRSHSATPPGPKLGPGPTGGGRGNLGAGTRGGMVPAPSPGSLPRSATLPGVLRRPGHPSPPGYPAPRNFGRLRAAELRATCEGEHGSQRCLPHPIGQEKSRRKQRTNAQVSICIHLQCAVTRPRIRLPSPTPARREPHLGCEQRVKYGAREGFGRYRDAEARKTPSHTPGADSPERTATSRQQINSNK